MAKIKHIIIGLLLIVSYSGFCQHKLRDQVQARYNRQLGVREATGKNDGKSVEVYLNYVKLSKGNPWCAAFVCWTLGVNGIENPRSGYSPVLFPKAKVIYQLNIDKNGSPQKADVFGIWFANKNRIAHVGFVDVWGPQYVITVEGNTNEAGSREGDGVYRKRRLTRQIYAVSSFIKQ
jgi:hypothetical protein